MRDRADSTAIREKTTGNARALVLAAVSCLFAISVVAGGHFLAEHQETVLRTERAKAEDERGHLVEALRDAHLTAPRLRLEELATLPLISEFVDVSDRWPDGEEAKELAAYLETVLSAAAAETGLARISLLDQNGMELLSATNFTRDADENPGLMIEADIPDINTPTDVAGKLAGVVANGDMTLLTGRHAASARTTASISTSADTGADAVSPIGIPATTRLLSLAAAIAIVFVGFAGCLHLRSRAGNR
ncbi:hypothetical protein [Roseibium sp.]|uniref:hypothetical protein n=1 Tax=Roseibium sp. TaxID=1936156 RepID=UPI003BA9B359